MTHRELKKLTAQRRPATTQRKPAAQRKPAESHSADENLLQSLPPDDCDVRIAISDNFDSFYIAVLRPSANAFLGAELVML